MTEKKRSRFDLFVVLQDNITSHYPQQKRAWCYRGDKFTDIEQKMLTKLITHLQRKIDRYKLAEIYDNTYPTNDENRIVILYNAGIVEKNNLPRYQELLDKFILPEFLK